MDPKRAVGKRRFARGHFQIPDSAPALKVRGIHIALPVNVTLRSKLAAVKIAAEKPRMTKPAEVTEPAPPSIQAVYHPSRQIHPGQAWLAIALLLPHAVNTPQFINIGWPFLLEW